MNPIDIGDDEAVIGAVIMFGMYTLFSPVSEIDA
jgi:hypothetical protein